MTAHRLTVERCAIAFEGIAIPGRGMITMQLAVPRQRWAVLKDGGGEVELLDMFETEAEAIEACKDVVAELERISKTLEGGSLQ